MLRVVCLDSVWIAGKASEFRGVFGFSRVNDNSWKQTERCNVWLEVPASRRSASRSLPWGWSERSLPLKLNEPPFLLDPLLPSALHPNHQSPAERGYAGNPSSTCSIPKTFVRMYCISTRLWRLLPWNCDHWTSSIDHLGRSTNSRCCIGMQRRGCWVGLPSWRYISDKLISPGVSATGQTASISLLKMK